MASALLEKIRRAREGQVDNMRLNGQDTADILENACRFLQEHSDCQANEATHSVFDNFSDWWLPNRPTYRLAVAEDNTVDQLYRIIAQLYELGIPLTLCEKKTSTFNFIQGIEIWGNAEETVTVEELVNPAFAFMKTLGSVMGSIFPGHKFLDCAIFDASGKSLTKGVMKTSVRFVWPTLVVNTDRAGKIHDYTVHKFKESSEPDLKAFEDKVKAWGGKENLWTFMFDDKLVFGRGEKQFVRMPCCDRVSPQPSQRPEQRPFKPVGVTRFNYNLEGELQGVEVVCGPGSSDGPEALANDEGANDWLFNWVKLGACRKIEGSELTTWVAPAWQGPVRPAGGEGRAPGDSGSGRGARQSGQVRVRTAGGSGESRGPPRRPGEPAPARADNTSTVTRAFEGTLADFKQSFDRVGLNNNHRLSEETVNGVQSMIWQQIKHNGEDDAGRIEANANQRVFIQGMSHQIRSYLTTMAGFILAEGAASTVASTQARTMRSKQTRTVGGASQAGSLAQRSGYAPSLAYAPSAVGRISQAGSLSSSRLIEAQPARRRVTQEFAAEGAGELSLRIGEIVIIGHDPEIAKADRNRWVHGRKEDETAEEGWFPFSYTDPMVEE